MRKLIFTLAVMLAIACLSLAPSQFTAPTVYARECSDDVINACHDTARNSYYNCLSMGNSDTTCMALRNKLESDCYRIHSCINN